MRTIDEVKEELKNLSYSNHSCGLACYDTCIDDSAYELQSKRNKLESEYCFLKKNIVEGGYYTFKYTIFQRMPELLCIVEKINSPNSIEIKTLCHSESPLDNIELKVSFHSIGEKVEI